MFGPSRPASGSLFATAVSILVAWLTCRRLRSMPRSIPDVAYVQENLFTCSEDAQNQMIEVIKEQGLNRVVVAACSPSTHQPIFQDMLRNAGLNKYLFEMANIRNHCTWVHKEEAEAATRKCQDLVNMGVAKARLLQPLPFLSVAVNKKALVIGGGVAGMSTALALAEQGHEVHLAERKNHLGGHALKLNSTWRGEPVSPFLHELIQEVKTHDNITLHLDSTVEEATGTVGNFTSTLSNGQTVDHGVVVLATGGESYKPEGMYLYQRSSQRAPLPGAGSGTGRKEQHDPRCQGGSLYPVCRLQDSRKALLQPGVLPPQR